jgi:hypothetical protein
MRYTLKTRDGRWLDFWAQDNGGYVYLEDDGGYTGTSRRQICDGGGFRGSTIMCGAGVDCLKAAARRWRKQGLAYERAADKKLGIWK